MKKKYLIIVVILILCLLAAVIGFENRNKKEPTGNTVTAGKSGTLQEAEAAAGPDTQTAAEAESAGTTYSVQETAAEAGTVAAEYAEQSEEEKEADLVAERLCDEAALREPEVTGYLQSFEDEHIYLEGLEFRLKTQESMARKLITDSFDKEISIEEAGAGIRDGLRYTFCIEDDYYVESVNRILRALTDDGYSVVKFKNFWDSDTYKGINTQLAVPDGYIFELQIHTPDSYKAKMDTHPYYEIIRSEDSTEEDIAEALEKDREIVATVHEPDGVRDLDWESLE